MANKWERIILDTNLWISFLITKDFSKLDKILFSRKAILIFSEELLEEFISVAKRPKFRKHFSLEDIEDVLETIVQYADFVEVKSKITACRDEKDNFLLSLSVDGNADFLITGDDDLLTLKKIDKTKIMTITAYLKNK